MKLLFYSTAPHIGVGYGTLSSALIKRFQQDGHEVKVATKHLFGGKINIGGVDVFNGTDNGLVWKIFQDEKFDFTISCFDHWTFHDTLPNWVGIEMLDTEYIHTNMIKVLQKVNHIVAVNQHAMGEYQRAGFTPEYAPLGADTKLFKPNAKARKAFREKMGWDDDTFVLGTVAINYNSDRKNYVGIIRAFQGFHKQYPNSVLYLHCDLVGSSTQGINLAWVIEQCGFNINNDNGNPIRFVNQKEYTLWSIGQKTIADTYNGIDCFCLPTTGEGFGLPVVEAQACGVPVIISDVTGLKEINFSGWLIPKNEDMYVYNNLLSWHVRVPPSAVAFYMDEAITSWKNKKEWKERKKKAREGALEYDWDVVYAKYWRPLLEKLANESAIVKELPNYSADIYQKFSGKPFMRDDCSTVCENKDCDKQKDTFLYLPKEELIDVPIDNVLKRLYPIVPSPKGKLMVSTKCKVAPVLSPRFIKECQAVVDILWTYPLIREEIQRLWKSYYQHDYIALEDLNKGEEFGELYANTLQKAFRTSAKLDEVIETLNIEKGSRILDVGCGDGTRVRQLQKAGYKAIGTEINEGWIDYDYVFKGDAENLPFNSNTFEVVASIDVLEHLTNPHTAIKELFRVSNKYVIVYITVLGDSTLMEDPTHKTFWTLEQWKRELSKYGKVVTIIKGWTGMVLEKKDD